MKYVGTSTGRWSAKKPPIQEIPRYDEEKRKKLRQLAGIEEKPKPSRGLRINSRSVTGRTRAAGDGLALQNIAHPVTERPLRWISLNDTRRYVWVEVRGRDQWGNAFFERALWPEPPTPEEVNGPGPW